MERSPFRGNIRTREAHEIHGLIFTGTKLFHREGFNRSHKPSTTEFRGLRAEEHWRRSLFNPPRHLRSKIEQFSLEERPSATDWNERGKDGRNEKGSQLSKGISLLSWGRSLTLLIPLVKLSHAKTYSRNSLPHTKHHDSHLMGPRVCWPGWP